MLPRAITVGIHWYNFRDVFLGTCKGIYMKSNNLNCATFFFSNKVIRTSIKLNLKENCIIQE